VPQIAPLEPVGCTRCLVSIDTDDQTMQHWHRRGGDSEFLDVASLQLLPAASSAARAVAEEHFNAWGRMVSENQALGIPLRWSSYC
jgi:hypothetical protein